MMVIATFWLTFNAAYSWGSNSSPCHTITDWGKGWVTDTIYGNPLIFQYSSIHVPFIRYMYVDIHWCPVYPLGSFAHVKIANRQSTDNSLVAVCSLSVPNPFCLVFVRYLSTTHVVHICPHLVVIPLCVMSVSHWWITNGHVIDKTTDKMGFYHKIL